MARTRKGSQVDIPSQGYGQGRQIAAIQQTGGGIAAPQASPIPGQPTDRLAQAAASPVGELPSVFGPTQRPNEPITTGAPFGPGAGPMVDPADPMLLLQAMWSVLPHPAIARLMQSDLG